ncbi:MAG: sugar nucleotide-binding protein [Humidesulfovibrio sp.]|nr:sugar nucleotide-binding protein [Humidesulfovibrio sp.]
MAHGTTLVIGAEGGIGQALTAALRREGRAVFGTSRRGASTGLLHLDLADIPPDFAAPADVRVAYLCAAVTATDQCRKNPAGTSRVNVHGTLRLAERLARVGAFVVFPSTNMVFDGSVAHRRADDARCPQSEYGRQKALAEEGLLAMGGQAAVVRLTKVLTPGMGLFANWSAGLKAGQAIAPFANMPMAPIPLDLVVRAMLDIGDRRAGGVWQISASRDVSYAEAALRLASFLGAPTQLVQPVPWREAAPDLEHVPEYTSLDASRLAEVLGLAAPDPLEALDNAYGAYA